MARIIRRDAMWISVDSFPPGSNSVIAAWRHSNQIRQHPLHSLIVPCQCPLSSLSLLTLAFGFPYSLLTNTLTKPS